VRDFVLSASPLTDGFRSRLTARIGPVHEWLVLQDLRRMPVGRLIRKLRTLSARCLFVTSEGHSDPGIVSLLCCMAGVSNSAAIAVIGPELVPRRVSLIQFLRNSFLIFGASVLGFLSLVRSTGKFRSLLSLERSRPVNRVRPPGRILYVKANLWFGVKAGGSVGHVAGVVNSFQGKGYQVSVCAVEPPPTIDPAVRFVQLPVPPQFGFPAEINLYRCDERFSRQLLVGEGRSACSFVYQRMSLGSTVGIDLARKLNVPLVLEYNGSEVWLANNWGNGLRFKQAAELAELANLRHAHLIVSVSEVLREELVSRGVEPGRVLVYPNCVDPKAFTPDRFSESQVKELRAKYGLTPESRVITFVGTFGRWHGADLLAKAIQTLAKESSEWLKRSGVHFLLVGDGVMMPKVRELLGEDVCKSYVTLTGLVPQHQAPLYLAASDILVSPHIPNDDGTRFFGSPTKLFEYMSMAKAIVASELEQIGQILSGGVRITELGETNSYAKSPAVLVKPGNVAELIAGIKFLCENSAAAHMLGENARREVLSRYTWDHHVDAILKTLELQDRCPS
jgi:glycosyltransferase involved in cell wall biosynthesis